MNKIDLIIIGAQKAGTTSLKNYLRSHPDLAGHPSVELSFFTDLAEYQKGFDSAFNKYFDKKKFKKVIAKNVTISLYEDSLIRLKEHNPDIKIVFLLREPVSRAYSAFTMAVKDGWMQRNFEELINIINGEKYNDIMYRKFIGHSFYAKHLETIFKYFSSENVRLFLFEDLKKNPQFVCDNIFNWLNLQDHQIKEKIYNTTFKPRSIRLAHFINALRRKENYFKKLARKMLPYPLFLNIGNYIINLNRSKHRFAPISDTERQDLMLHFEEPNKELVSLLNKEKYNQCLIMYSRDNWIYKIEKDLYE